MPQAILTLNAGSSSIKFALFPVSEPIDRTAEVVGQIDGIGVHPHFSASDHKHRPMGEAQLDASWKHADVLRFLLGWLHEHDAGYSIGGVGHRVVHGSSKYAAPQRLNPALVDELDGLTPLAPLHQPHNIAAIRAVTAVAPQLPQVACFDTAFHRTQPELAQAFALPRRFSDLGVRRYGFHGLSYEFIARELPAVLGATADAPLVVAHLGNGASLCAMKDRQSVATSMGFTALDGLVMGTRCGTIDPGVLLYLMQFHNMGHKEITQLLYKESGLLGVSGISSDMRDLLESDAVAAREAVDLFCYRAAREIGSLAMAAGGLQALVFTGGIGEHAAVIRQRICQHMEWLGLRLDSARNKGHESVISSDDSGVKVAVIPTNEEWIIAMHTARLLSS